ncbi:MAG: rhomboid family intramembrane serine protease [Microbacterium sp.]
MSSDLPHNPDNYCYRHADRQSFVMCQRCLRTICPECQTQGPVGVICPECMKEQKRNRTPAQKRAQRRWGSGGAVALSGGGTRVTTWLAIVIAGAYVLSLLSMAIPAFDVKGWLLFWPPYIYPQSGFFEPWRLLTVSLTHSGIWHVGLNLLSLWMIGRVLEPIIGGARFLALFLLSTLGGSVAVALLAFDTPVVGASGAIFGLVGALVVIARRLGGDITGILIMVGINLVIGFIPGFNVAWQAHVGGLVTGLVLGLILSTSRKRQVHIGGFVAVGVVLIALLFVPPALGFPVLT